MVCENWAKFSTVSTLQDEVICYPSQKQSPSHWVPPKQWQHRHRGLRSAIGCQSFRKIHRWQTHKSLNEVKDCPCTLIPNFVLKNILEHHKKSCTIKAQLIEQSSGTLRLLLEAVTSKPSKTEVTSGRQVVQYSATDSINYPQVYIRVAEIKQYCYKVIFLNHLSLKHLRQFTH